MGKFSYPAEQGESAAQMKLLFFFYYYFCKLYYLLSWSWQRSLASEVVSIQGMFKLLEQASSTRKLVANSK